MCVFFSSSFFLGGGEFFVFFFGGGGFCWSKKKQTEGKNNDPHEQSVIPTQSMSSAGTYLESRGMGHQWAHVPNTFCGRGPHLWLALR